MASPGIMEVAGIMVSAQGTGPGTTITATASTITVSTITAFITIAAS
jgi:hypothetical protein